METEVAGQSPVERRVRALALSPACKTLLNAMIGGVKVHGMFGMHSYYFRDDTMQHCTRTVEALIKRGLAVETGRTWRGSIVRAAMLPAL